MPLNSPDCRCQLQAEPGTLYVVATPIGHLHDITLRALAILQSVDIIAAEDTRRTGILLKAHHIDTRLISYHEHNEKRRCGELVEKLQAGSSVALVCDAGTPTISDPGCRLVRTATTNSINVAPLPGVSAATAALSVSGLSTNVFMFIGFPEKKSAKRAKQLASLADRRETLIFYESPRRVIALLQAIYECLGDRPAVLAREMTKLNEEFIRGPVSQIITELNARTIVKGECTLLVSGQFGKKSADAAKIAVEIAKLLAAGKAGTADISREIAIRFQISKKKAYALVLELNQTK